MNSDCRSWKPVVSLYGHGFEPHGEAVLHVRHDGERDGRGGGEQADTHDDVDDARGGHIHERDEDGHEEQRHAEVLGEHEHGQRQDPHDQQWAEVLGRRQGDPEQVARGHGEQDLLVVEVAREEDDDGELRELGRLDAEAEGMDPQLGAVDRRAEDDGADEERQADGADDVPVTVELHVVADDEHGDDEQSGADQQPLPLRERQRRLDAEDLREPDRRQQGGDRQQERVGLWEQDPHHHVQQQEDADEHEAVDDRDAVDLAEPAGVDRHVRHRADRPGQHEEHELEIAPAHGHISSCSETPMTSALARSARASTSARSSGVSES